MGLFSKFGKNKQESTEDSGYYRAADDRNLAERARAKRAAHAGAEAAAARGRSRSGREAPDPVLPEKKRARRRLVGAIALALAVAIGLPMVLDSEPKPLANDIAIQIPAREKSADDDKTVAAAKEDDKQDNKPAGKVAQDDALDQSEEIVEPADPAPKVALAKPEAKPPVVWTEPKESKPEPKKPEAKPEPKPEPKHEAKPEPKPERKVEKPEPKVETRRAEVKPEAKPEPKREARPEQKPDDAARALAILEGKAAAKPAESEGSSRYVIQVAALSAKDKVDELQGKLQAAGIKSFTQKSPSGELTRVKVGPFGSREEAEKARARLQKIGLSGSLVPV
jgi:DedD protein